MEIKYGHNIFLTILFLSTIVSYAQEKDSILLRFQELNETGQFQKTLKLHRSGKFTGPYYYTHVASAFEDLNKEDSAFHYYKLAKDGFLNKQLWKQAALMNLEIGSILESQNNLEADIRYFDDFWEYATDAKDSYLLAKGHNYKGRTAFMDEDPYIPITHFKIAHGLFLKMGETEMAIKNLMNIGAVYSNRLNNNDSARVHYFKAFELLKKNKVHLNNPNLYHDFLNNIGNSYRRSEGYVKALKYYKRAETLQVKKYQTKTKKILYGNMRLTYYHLNDFENAYNYLSKYDSIKDLIGLASQNSTISDIREKYDNQKLRADNLEIEARRIKNQNWLIAAGLAILFGIGITILLQKNTTKKRKLAEQKALLEQQKVETLLKEQELVSIDAMIAGQEKERTKVANELHDDLGSLMATVKLHFDNLKVDKKDPALKNVQDLLERAYQKIRGMAHAKNSGVMANQGLLPAIKKIAKTISETNALEVTVEDFGLGERMENSLELIIFRILQELIANIIKHAKATKANIQFTQHGNNLNIIVEDNGKGFDMSAIQREKNGMGLGTIEKRIEHLEGSFTVDSILGKGTSILIDIPV